MASQTTCVLFTITLMIKTAADDPAAADGEDHASAQIGATEGNADEYADWNEDNGSYDHCDCDDGEEGEHGDDDNDGSDGCNNRQWRRKR